MTRNEELLNRGTPLGSLEQFLIPPGLIPDPDYEHRLLHDGTVILHVMPATPSEPVVCGTCGSETRRNGYALRVSETWPIAGHRALLVIRSPRYQCKNKDCEVNTFVLPIPGLPRYQRRTDELNEQITSQSLFVSALTAELLCNMQEIKISDDTIRRLISRIEIIDDPTLDFIGVDDMCRKRNKTYFTAIYNGYNHCLIALLYDRDGKELEAYLRDHPNIKKVARDRDSSYGQVITAVNPDIEQIADPFHVLQNAIDHILAALESVLPPAIYVTEEGAILSKKPPGRTIMVHDVTQTKEYKNLGTYDDTAPMDENGDIIIFREKKPTVPVASDDPNSKENKALARYEKITEIQSTWGKRSNGTRKHDADLRKELMATYEVSYAVLGQYLHMSDKQLEALLAKTHPDDKMAPFSNMIYKMLRDRISPACIYQYVLEQGYSGSPFTLRERIATISLYNGFGKIPLSDIFKATDLPEGVYKITPSRIVEWMTVVDEKMKASMEKTAVARTYSALQKAFPVIQQADELWTDLHNALMGDDPDKIDTFCSKHADSIVPGFVERIERDAPSIKNAIISNISSGFVEGGNCQFKLVKRMFFGRASRRLLLRTCYGQFMLRHGLASVNELLSTPSATASKT